MDDMFETFHKAFMKGITPENDPYAILVKGYAEKLQKQRLEKESDES